MYGFSSKIPSLKIFVSQKLVHLFSQKRASMNEIELGIIVLRPSDPFSRFRKRSDHRFVSVQLISNTLAWAEKDVWLFDVITLNNCSIILGTCRKMEIIGKLLLTEEYVVELHVCTPEGLRAETTKRTLLNSD